MFSYTNLDYSLVTFPINIVAMKSKFSWYDKDYFLSFLPIAIASISWILSNLFCFSDSSIHTFLLLLLLTLITIYQIVHCDGIEIEVMRLG